MHRKDEKSNFNNNSFLNLKNESQMSLEGFNNDRQWNSSVFTNKLREVYDNDKRIKFFMQDNPLSGISLFEKKGLTNKDEEDKLNENSMFFINSFKQNNFVQNEDSKKMKDIKIEFFEEFRQKNDEHANENLHSNALHKDNTRNKNEYELCQNKIGIISPHLYQYFRKNEYRIKHDLDLLRQMTIMHSSKNKIILKTKLSLLNKSLQNKIKLYNQHKQKELNSKQKQAANYLTINQHINIQNINSANPNISYPISQNENLLAVQEQNKIQEEVPGFIMNNINGPEQIQMMDSGNFNYDYIYKMGLQDKLFLDVDNWNLYLKLEGQDEPPNSIPFDLKKFEQNFSNLLKKNNEINKDIPKQPQNINIPKLNPKPEVKSQNKKSLKINYKSQPMNNIEELFDKSDNSLPSLNDNNKSLDESVPVKKTIRYKKIKKKKKKNGCKCSKSNCLRLHCQCFKNGNYCDVSCGCEDCFNDHQHADLVDKVRRETKNINSQAFKSIFLTIIRDGKEIKITKGCSCMKNNCLKNYCECKKYGLNCSSLCKCDKCKNCQIKLEPEEVNNLIHRSSRKKKKIIFQRTSKNQIDIQFQNLSNK